MLYVLPQSTALSRLQMSHLTCPHRLPLATRTTVRHVLHTASQAVRPACFHYIHNFILDINTPDQTQVPKERILNWDTEGSLMPATHAAFPSLFLQALLTF